MLDTDKVSLELAAQYVGLSTQAMEQLSVVGWLQPVAHACQIPVYLGADLKRLKKAAPPETPEQKVQREIREKRENIQQRIDMSTEDMLALREQCMHPNVKKENKANTGNYDPSADYYWRDCACPDCGKRWSEVQKG
jgi:hypothetical protein